MAASGEHPLEDELARPSHAIGLGEDLNAVGDRVVAGGHHADPAAHVNLDRADAAHAVGLEQRVMAQRGNPDAGLLRHLQQRRAVLGFGPDAVDRDCHELHLGLQRLE